MTNYEIADHFSLLSKLMDIHGENSFKSKSYSIAAFNIEKLPAEAATLTDAELFAAKGIGDSTGKKIKELLATGRLAVLEEIKLKTPPGILDMMQVKGLGPKKIAVVWNELGIESVGELEYACNENRLVALKGFGAKTQESILQSIAYIKQNEGFFLWAEASVIAGIVIERLKAMYPAYNFLLSGAMRRQLEIIDTVDIVTDAPKEEVNRFFEGGEGVQIMEESTVIKCTVPGQPLFSFHFSDADSICNRLFTTTGSEEFTTAFMQRYQLPAAPDAEQDIFESAGLQYIPPSLREDAAVIERAAANAIPQLITGADIKGIIHSHSTWSDGNNTIEEMALAAIERGFEYLVISDHSQTASYAGGLKPERIAAQHNEVDALNKKLAPFRIFKSIESDILGDGSLDYSDSVLATFDLVIASVHSNLKMTEEKAMARVMAAISNPYTTILGHPTGRLLLSRKGYPLDHKAIIDACAEHKVVIEINAHPRRLDMDWRWIAYAQEKGVLLSIDPDAHSINGLNDVYYGVLSAEKGGLVAASNLSSFSLAEFEAFIATNNMKRPGGR